MRYVSPKSSIATAVVSHNKLLLSVVVKRENEEYAISAALTRMWNNILFLLGLTSKLWDVFIDYLIFFVNFYEIVQDSSLVVERKVRR